MHELDTRGKLCPQPLIMTRKLLKTLADGEAFAVEVDNQIAHDNLVTFLKDQKCAPSSEAFEGYWIIRATKAAAVTEVAPAAVAAPARSDYIVVLKNDKMGLGDDELGATLIKGYLNALLEIDAKPSAIIMYNAGVKLAAIGSGAEGALQALAEQGVELIVCGACVNFFELGEQLACGTISNMYVIGEKIAACGHVVYP